MHVPYGSTLYIQGWVHDFLNGVSAGVYYHFIFIEPEHDDRKRMGMKVWLFVNTFFTILYYYLIFVFIVILFKNFIDHDHLSYRKRSFEMRQY